MLPFRIWCEIRQLKIIKFRKNILGFEPSTADLTNWIKNWTILFIYNIPIQTPCINDQISCLFERMLTRTPMEFPNNSDLPDRLDFYTCSFIIRRLCLPPGEYPNYVCMYIPYTVFSVFHLKHPLPTENSVLRTNTNANKTPKVSPLYTIILRCRTGVPW